LIGWMIPGKHKTAPWTGQMSISRDMSLKKTADGYRLLQEPAGIVRKALPAGGYVERKDVAVSGEVALSGLSGNAYWLDAELALGTATTAGFIAQSINHAGQILLSVDADLQDDIQVIPEMMQAYARGAQVVYGVRNDRTSDGLFKRATAHGFYRLIRALGAESIYNHADFRLMSRRAVEALKTFREVNLFLRGMVPLIGFKSAIVYYTRSERFAGVSKYPLRKMVALALDAVTSFSVAPLRFITGIGFAVFLLSAAMGMWTLWVRLFTDRAVPGWTSTLLPIYLLGGIQILCIGVIGEYLGKVYQETKARPRYIIEKHV